MKIFLPCVALLLAVGVGLSAINSPESLENGKAATGGDVQVIAKGKGFVHDGRALADVMVVGVPGDSRTPMILMQLSLVKADGTIKKVSKRYEGKLVPDETNFLFKDFASLGYSISVTCPGRGWRHISKDPYLFASEFDPGKVKPLPLRVVLSTND